MSIAQPHLSREIFQMELRRLTPSQLCVSAEKLTRVNRWFRGNPDNLQTPLPVKRLAGRLLLTDGHTRCAAAWQAGIERVPCAWDLDDLDWAAYAADISLCAEAGVTSIAQLARRVVSPAEYKAQWLDLCDQLYQQSCYQALRQRDDLLFFTNRPLPPPPETFRLSAEPGEAREMCRLLLGDAVVACGCIEKFSYAFWEIARLQACPEALPFLLAALTNHVVSRGKTALFRARPGDDATLRLLAQCGYEKLY